VKRRSDLQASNGKECRHEDLLPRGQLQPPEVGQRCNAEDEVGGNADGGARVDEVDKVITLGADDGKVPCSGDGSALEDSRRHSSDEHSDDDGCADEHDVAQRLVGKDSHVRGDDGELGEGDGAGIGDVPDKQELCGPNETRCQLALASKRAESCFT
jgi:hypothetical protein